MVIPVILAVLVGILIFGGVMALDRNRIRSYIAAQGGSVLSINWNPLGPGWFGEKDSNIYRVRYRDADGAVREARCKTGFFSGVYFTQDAVVHRGPTPNRQTVSTRGGTGQNPNYDDLLAENRRLKDEVNRLRDELQKMRS